MQVAWRRKGGDPSAEATFDVVVQELRGAASRLMTGALEFESEGRLASIFILDGAPYSVDLPGYTPRIAARMHAAGWIDDEQRDSLITEFAPMPTLAGKAAVDRGWVDAEQLGQLHQEYLLSSLGGLCSAVVADIRSESGATTDRLCTIPVDLESLVPALRLRADRASSTWSAMAVGDDPSHVLFTEEAPVPEGMRVPEVIAVHRALDVGRSADEVGELLGLTRAEVVHVLGALAANGVVRHSWGVVPPPVGHLRVPEAFGDAHRRS